MRVNRGRTASTSGAQTSVDWKYLQREYGALLAKPCGSQLPDAQLLACLGEQKQGIDALARDAPDLPRSADRGKLLDALAEYNRQHQRFADAQCPYTASPNCGGAVTMISIKLLQMSQLVKANSS